TTAAWLGLSSLREAWMKVYQEVPQDPLPMPVRTCSGEKGATLIEFALILPLLLLLILGIVEFGWLFGQYNDVRHGAREGARFAAVDAGAFNDILAHVCSSMDGLSGGMSAIQV